MTANLAVQVALPVPIPRTFTYRLPSPMAVACQPGCRVRVPFGRKSLIGVAVAVGTEPGFQGDLRNVVDVLDTVPAVSGELLDFTRWLADYYFAPWGLVLQAALPAALRTRTRRIIEISEAGREVLENPFSRALALHRRVLDLLARRGPLAPGRLRSLLPVAGAALLSRIESRGWIRILEREAPPPGLARLEEWTLPGRLPPPTGSRALGGRQRRILETLRQEGGAIRSADLLQSTGASRSSLRTLADKGWLSLEKRPERRRSAGPPAPSVVTAPPLLEHQRVAVGAIRASLDRGGFRCFLLEGVTGSGKTEVYMAAASHALALGRGVLYMVPEIGLTPLLEDRLEERFPGQVAVLHSGLPERERRERWERIRQGEASLILGTRSALFAPHRSIGLVIVDEEQDVSYYQAESPRYHARDAALVRARRLQATVVLGSATPSLEAVASVRRKKFDRLFLPERVEKRPLPEVQVIDMREEFLQTGVQSLLSRRLVAAIREVRAEGSQALLLLNRRGFSTFVICRACGHRLECSGCSIAMTYHRTEARLRCHYCNSRRLLPAVCPKCRSPHLHPGGAGTERLEEAIRILDPLLRVARMDRDTSRGKGHELLLRRFERREIDLMLGTQMLAKGHDFPGVTLVGILSADALLALPDFRAAERTYQLLAQAAGRAGRGARPGRVLIQAFATDHPAIQAAAMHDPGRFYERELHLREAMAYPPWVALTQIRVEDRNPGRGEASARCVARQLRLAASGRYVVLGPAPAPFSKLKGEYRYQILLKGKSRSVLAAGIREALGSLDASRELPASLVVETDPRSLL